MILSELLESIKKSGIFEFFTVDDPKNNENVLDSFGVKIQIQVFHEIIDI